MGCTVHFGSISTSDPTKIKNRKLTESNSEGLVRKPIRRMAVKLRVTTEYPAKTPNRNTLLYNIVSSHSTHGFSGRG